MLRSLMLAILIVAGTFLVFRGSCAWYERHRAIGVVQDYLQAQREGNRELALGTLEASLRLAVIDRYPDRIEWPRCQEFEFRILAVESTTDPEQPERTSWQIQARIDQDGYLLHPWFVLRQNESGQWRIAGIDGGEIDPQWLADQGQLGKESGERLAAEILQKIDGAQGVSVERY